MNLDKNFESWSDEELSQFLVSDYFNSVKKTWWYRDITEKSFLDSQEAHIKKYQKYKIILDPLDAFFLNFYQKGNGSRRKKILFELHKYGSFIKEAKKYYHVGLIAQGEKDRMFAFKNLIGYISANDLDELIVLYLKEKNVKYLRLLLQKVEQKIKIMGPDYIVLIHDVFPIERAIILVGRKLDIPTMVMQHALHTLSLESIFDFKAAQYVLVWGKHFKELCEKMMMRKPEDIFVLGYPEIIKKIDAGLPRKYYTVCYLGQDIQRYYKDLLSIKLETIREISEICKKLGMNFVYRPHYAENRNELLKQLPEIQFTQAKETLSQTFKNSDILISAFSTALVEAAMVSKVALQFMNYPIDVADFEKLGVGTKSFKTIEELGQYLEKISKSENLDEFETKFNNEYVETRYNPGKRFLEIITEIDKK